MRLIGAALLFACLPALAAPVRVVTDMAVTVVVDGDGWVPSPVWVMAKGGVTRAFARIGVKLEWERGPVLKFAPDRLVFALHIAARGNRHSGMPPVCENADALACSRPSDPAGASVIVMYDRLPAGRPGHGAMWPLLANVIIHEIAHALEMDGRHTRTGMMKARLTPADISHMRDFVLEFTAEDVKSIQAGLDYRHRRP